jgi:hypothetical protein
MQDIDNYDAEDILETIDLFTSLTNEKKADVLYKIYLSLQPKGFEPVLFSDTTYGSSSSGLYTLSVFSKRVLMHVTLISVNTHISSRNRKHRILVSSQISGSIKSVSYTLIKPYLRKFKIQSLICD